MKTVIIFFLCSPGLTFAQLRGASSTPMSSSSFSSPSVPAPTMSSSYSISQQRSTFSMPQSGYGTQSFSLPIYSSQPNQTTELGSQPSERFSSRGFPSGFSTLSTPPPSSAVPNRLPNRSEKEETERSCNGIPVGVLEEVQDIPVIDELVRGGDTTSFYHNGLINSPKAVIFKY